MLVYSVFLDDGEAYHFRGVFGSHEEAERFVRGLEEFSEGYYSFGILASLLGEPVDLIDAPLVLVA